MVISRALKSTNVSIITLLSITFSPFFLYTDCLTDIRQSLAAPKLTKQTANAQLADLLHSIQQSLLDQTKSVLANLQVLNKAVLASVENTMMICLQARCCSHVN